MPTLFVRALSPAQPLQEGFEFACEWLVQEADGRQHSEGASDYRGLLDLDADWAPFWHGLRQQDGAGDGNEARGEEAKDKEGAEQTLDWARDPGNVVLLAPNEHVLSVSCEVPGRNAGQIRRALPFVAEEFLAADLEGTHLASGPIRRGQPVRCCVIDEQLLQDWLACLESLGIRPGWAIPEAELLPAEPRNAAVLLEGDAALLRSPQQSATLDRANLALALNALEIDKLQVAGGALTDIERGQLDLEIETLEAEQGAETALSYLARRWQRHPEALNLLQGRHAPSMPRNPNLAKWRNVAALAAVWLALGLAGMAGKAAWSSMEADSLERQALALYRDLFAQDRTATVQSIRRRALARLGERNAAAGRPMVQFAADLAAVLDDSMSLSGIDYNEARGEFATELVLQRYDDVERVREALAAQGLKVEIASAEQSEDGVRARLRLQGG